MRLKGISGENMGIFKLEIHRDIRGEKFEGFFKLDIQDTRGTCCFFSKPEIHGNFKRKICGILKLEIQQDFREENVNFFKLEMTSKPFQRIS